MEMELVGEWVIDPQDEESLRNYGEVTLNFTKDYWLIYTIHSEDKDRVIFLTYKVENGKIITNQPSNPHEEITPYSLTLDGKLILFYDDHKTTYVRVGSQN